MATPRICVREHFPNGFTVTGCANVAGKLMDAATPARSPALFCCLLCEERSVRTSPALCSEPPLLGTSPCPNLAVRNLAMEHTGNKQVPSTSPQKQTVKNRSRSTDEVQQAKKAFHTPQKSLPAKPETEKLEVKPNFTTHQPLVSHHLKDQPHSHIATRQHTRSVLSPQSVCHLTPRRWRPWSPALRQNNGNDGFIQTSVI
ncbi:hypothetical protein P4O66_016595, partial [Electrophorus voltai]